MANDIAQKVNDFYQAKSELDFFDLNLWWDPVHNQGFKKFADFGDLYDSLTQYPIRKAVLTHAECNKYDPKTGNAALARLIAGRDNLYGAMVLTADHLISGEDVKKYIDSLVDARLVIARLFPKLHNHPMKKNALGDVFQHLNDRRIPLVLWHAQTTWDTIESLCTDYPDLPVIVEGNDVKLLYHNRFYVPLFKKLSNFYLETHNVILFKELDVLAGIHPDKLIFGSYYQYNNPDTAMASIVFGNMDKPVKQLIAHGNLDRLIQAVR